MNESQVLIRGSRVLLDDELRVADVLCREGKVAAVGESLDAADARIVEAEGHVLGPGFVDVHVHGGGGSSFFTRDASRIAAYSSWAPRSGVTSYLVSTSGRHPADVARTLEGLAPAIGRAQGAESLGFHLEGPFLNPRRAGAFQPESLRDPNPNELRRFLDAAEGKVRQVTLAPERPGAHELIALLAREGVVAAMGHSDATFEEARAGIDAGARHITHLFNAMRPMHQREGGIAAAALVDGRVTCEVIADGVHVSREMLQLAWQVLGPKRMIAVTDNLHLAGTPQQRASFLGRNVDAEGGAVVRDDGTIVGSLQPMDVHFRNLVRNVGLTVSDAFAVCSTNPAKLAGIAESKGAISPGYDADLVLLDEDLRPVLTLCRGRVAYEGFAEADASRARNASTIS